TYTLSVEQSTRPTPGQPDKKPLHIPLTVGLVGSDGNDLPLTLEGENTGPTSRVLNVQDSSQTFVFTGVDEKPVHSVLRGFSAPVTLDHGLSGEESAFLMGHDSDPFNRWEAGQQLATDMMLKLISDHQAGHELVLDENFATAYGQLLRDEEADKAFIALAMGLPTPSFLAQKMDEVDMDAIGAVHLFVREALAARFRDDLLRLYRANHIDEPYAFNAEAAGRRSLKNAALGLLMRLGDREAVELCAAQFHEADNMTEEQAALAFLVNSDADERLAAIEAFEQKWKSDALVMDKWFMVQATSEREDALERVRELMGHPAFSLRNPNKVRAVIGAFTQGNPLRFHAADGSGYELLADVVLQLDAMNPQIAARLMGAFEQWTRFAQPRKGLMQKAVERVLETEKISRDVYEIASKTLKA
ncbi:MAG: DUF3458 domain-containing protein, partial [Alphaproteobacteria bacterium]|nr:DUF3458 domain-containing protein [Alphaproteobacteria bacterium]